MKSIAQTFFRSLVAVTALAGLASCGGGGGGAGVNTIQASNIRFNGTAVIAVSGRNLLTGVEMLTEGGCINVIRVAGGDDNTQQFTCQVRSVEDIKAHVVDSSGAFIGTVTFKAPVPRVSVATTSGTLLLELDPAKAPQTVINFLTYVSAGFYSVSGTGTTTNPFLNILFHRVIPNVGILTGGYVTGVVARTTGLRDPIPLESNNGLTNVRGAVGMWRTGGPNSATSQWFINVGDNPNLDFVNADNPGYAVFGKVISGIEVADTISTVETRFDLDTLGGLGGVPVTEVKINSITQTQ